MFSWCQKHCYALVLQPHFFCFEVDFDESQTIPKNICKAHVREWWSWWPILFIFPQTIQNANFRYIEKYTGWKTFWQWVVFLTKVIFSWPKPNSFPCGNIIILQFLTRTHTHTRIIKHSISHYPDIRPVWYQICSLLPLVLLVVTRILFLLRGISLNQKAPCRSNYTNVIFTLTGPYVPIGKTTLHKMRSHPNGRC